MRTIPYSPSQPLKLTRKMPPSRKCVAALFGFWIWLAGTALAATPVVTVSSNATSIPRYDIYELTMTHVGTYTYPDFDVIINTTFTMPSGTTFTVGGFFYDTNTWKSRFAPKEVGNYTWTLSFDNGSGTPYTTSGSFTCTSSSNSGFVAISPSNPRRFITEGNGKPFYINGYNIGYTLLPFNPSPMKGTTDSSFPQMSIPLADVFSTYRRGGLNIYRYNWQAQNTPNGPAYLSSQLSAGTGKCQFSVVAGKRIDELADAVHRSGMKYMFTISTGPLIGNPQWNTTNPGNATALTNYVKNFISRWGAYADIWEIGNELQGMPQDYLDVMTSAFHNNDPYNHPLTNSYQYANLNETGLTAANSHNYRAVTNVTLDQGWAYSAGTAVVSIGQYYGAIFGGVYCPSMRELYPSKPIYSGECGNTASYGNYDPERYRIPLWTTSCLESGVIYWLRIDTKFGYQVSAGYTNMYIGTEERSMARILANQVSDIDTQVAALPLSSVVCSSTTSFRGYVMSSTQNMIGYFVHATDHYSVLSGMSVTLPIPADNMRGQWINPMTGDILQNFTVSSGTRTLSVPPFQADIGLRIRPANSAPVVEFAKASYITWENSGSITVTVNRANSSSGAVSVQYATSDGLAVAGTNYTAANGTLSWADGDTSPKQIVIPVLNDGVADWDKDFQIFLSNPTGGAILGGNDNALVAVCDTRTNFIPLQSSLPTATTTTTTKLNYTILGTGSPTSFNATNLPSGLTVSTTTGLITGTVTTPGVYPIPLTFTAAGGIGSGTLTLTVNNPTPVITSAATASGTTGTPFSYVITASNSPTSFNATGLPAGLAVNTSTGVISGTATATGTSTINLSAANVSGTGTKTLALTISAPYALWNQSQFTAGELSNPAISSGTATPANDGIPNLLKYALNLKPKTCGVQGLPLVGGTTILGSDYLTLSYTHVKASNDITYIVEVSGDLQTWQSGIGFTAPVSILDQGATETVTVQDLVPESGIGKRFIRLKVTQP